MHSHAHSANCIDTMVVTTATKKLGCLQDFLRISQCGKGKRTCQAGLP